MPSARSWVTRRGTVTWPWMVLQQHEAAQFRPEVAGNPGRHRREHGQALGGHPAFAADAHDVRPHHKILDDEVLIALEARAGRNRGRDDALFVDDQPRGLALLRPMLSDAAHRLGLGLLLHAARLDRRTRRHALQPGDLRAQFSHRPLQRGVLRQQALGQGLKVATRQARKGDLFRSRHARKNWRPTGTAQPHSASYLPGVLPLLPFWSISTASPWLWPYLPPTFMIALE